MKAFDPEEADGWFCQAEAIMDLAGVKSQATKWACVVTALEDKGSRLVASKNMKSPNPGTQYKDEVLVKAICGHQP